MVVVVAVVVVVSVARRMARLNFVMLPCLSPEWALEGGGAPVRRQRLRSKVGGGPLWERK
ncbi:hypothetical protein GCM10009680_61150 [Streptomyces yatensis]|uniref:Secreted protein n=1 Tax=Streptomyces yatensis TaxID=155177 RepID=A0ABN2IUS3_9ACTN